MNLTRLRDFTSARVAQGRVGSSLPTRELLEFQLAHARARDAVHSSLDTRSLAAELMQNGMDSLLVHSAAPDRATYLRRPDLGRRLSDSSRVVISAARGNFDVAFIAADGLSALAIQRHAAPVLELAHQRLQAQNFRLAPVVIAHQGRVAIGDELGQLLGASLVVVLIGERPGLSSPDSLGIYLTWNPRPGLTDADRNCISNVRSDGLSYAAAVQTLDWLIHESWRRKLSGVALKDHQPPTVSIENRT